MSLICCKNFYLQYVQALILLIFQYYFFALVNDVKTFRFENESAICNGINIRNTIPAFCYYSAHST